MRSVAGFTLVELVAVILIAGFLFQLVTMNLGAMIPERALDAAAAQLRSQVNFLRSEARLQGKPYTLELDLENNRFRVLIPPEDSLIAMETAQEAFDLGWVELDERVRFDGAQVAGGAWFKGGLFGITFDQDGYTADQAIYLVHVAEEELIWTLQIRGLTGQSELVRSLEGEHHPIESADEGQF